MRLKTIAGIGLSAIASAGALAAGIYYLATRDSTPIRMDPRIYDDYAGYYILPNGYPITIQRERDRLILGSGAFLMQNM